MITRTTDRLLIQNDRVIFPTPCIGVISERALVFRDISTGVYRDFKCKKIIDGSGASFSPDDELNGFYAVISYLERPEST